METITVTSSSNSLLKRIRLLQSRSGREKTGCFLIEGIKLFDEAVTHGAAVEEVVISQSFADNGFDESSCPSHIQRLVIVEDKLFEPLATTETPQGLIAVAKTKHHQPDELFSNTIPLVVIADRVQDPGNLGTMFRTALAFGATGMILTKGSVDAYNPKVVRSSAGALFALPFLEDINIEDAVRLSKERGLSVFAFSMEGSVELSKIDLAKPSALLMGNEANGLTLEVEQSADMVVSIPMSKMTESLNVAIANAVVLYEACRQRGSDK